DPLRLVVNELYSRQFKTFWSTTEHSVASGDRIIFVIPLRENSEAWFLRFPAAFGLFPLWRRLPHCWLFMRLFRKGCFLCRMVLSTSAWIGRRSFMWHLD